MGFFSKLKPSSPKPNSYQNGPPPYSSTPTSSSNSNNLYPPPSSPSQPINSDTRPLPSGWISQYDPSSNRFFYVYTPTALRQWEHPADKPLNYGGNSSYGQSSPYQQQSPYSQQQRYGQQPQYVQQPQYFQQPQYVQQPQYLQGRKNNGGMSFGKVAAAGLGGALVGNLIGDALFDNHPDIIENNYYDSGPGDFGGGDFGGGDFGGGDFGGSDFDGF